VRRGEARDLAEARLRQRRPRPAREAVGVVGVADLPGGSVNALLGARAQLARAGAALEPWIAEGVHQLECRREHQAHHDDDEDDRDRPLLASAPSIGPRRVRRRVKRGGVGPVERHAACIGTDVPGLNCVSAHPKSALVEPPAVALDRTEGEVTNPARGRCGPPSERVIAADADALNLVGPLGVVDRERDHVTHVAQTNAVVRQSVSSRRLSVVRLGARLLVGP